MFFGSICIHSEGAQTHAKFNFYLETIGKFNFIRRIFRIEGLFKSKVTEIEDN